MCIEGHYVLEIEKIMKDEDLANYEQLEKVFALKSKYEKELQDFLDEEVDYDKDYKDILQEMGS